MIATETVSRYDRDGADPAKTFTKLRDEMAKEIATKVLDEAFRAMLRTRLNY
jgi:hypothetical protein